jgi:hypothetical protein
MNPRSSLEIAQSLGFTLPSPAYLIGALLFGIVGLAAFRIGRKRQTHRTTALGMALMLYPYLVSQTWILWAVGAALCAGLWIDHQA